MSDFFSGQVCFLSQPEWQAVLKETWARVDPPEIGKLFFEFTYYLSLSPPIVGRGFDLREKLKSGTTIHPEEAKELLDQTLSIYERLCTWAERLYSTITPPIEVPSAHEDLFPNIYIYDNVTAGALYCGYYALMIVCQLLLTVAGYDNLLESAEDFADRICKSAEYVGTGPLGSYRIGFSVRIAYELDSKPRRIWIRNLLARHSKDYAAMNVKSYPDI
jgi:hypothetical protein